MIGSTFLSLGFSVKSMMLFSCPHSSEWYAGAHPSSMWTCLSLNWDILFQAHCSMLTVFHLLPLLTYRQTAMNSGKNRCCPSRRRDPWSCFIWEEGILTSEADRVRLYWPWTRVRMAETDQLSDSIMVFSGARRSSSKTLNPCVYNFWWFCFACMCKAPSRPPLSLALCGFISQTKFSIPNCVWNKLRWIYWWMLISASPCFVPRHINSWPCCSCELLCFRVSFARH
jgi:hypothetical protein